MAQVYKLYSIYSPWQQLTEHIYNSDGHPQDYPPRSDPVVCSPSLHGPELCFPWQAQWQIQSTPVQSVITERGKWNTRSYSTGIRIRGKCCSR